MNARDVKALFDKSISFHPVLARMTGNVCAGLMLSQAIYWSSVLEKDPDRADGWFYKSQAEWEEELCIGRWEQETARRCLRRFAFWQEKRCGSPAKLWFRLDFETLAESIGQYVGKPHSRMRETHTLDRGKTSGKNGEKHQSLKGTESTAEITLEPASSVPSVNCRKSNDDEFFHALFPEVRNQFPQIASERRFLFAIEVIKARSKGQPSNRRAFWRTSLRKFFAAFDVEAKSFLREEFNKILDRGTDLPSAIEDLKCTAARYELPYELLEGVIGWVIQKRDREAASRAEAHVGEFVHAEVSAD